MAAAEDIVWARAGEDTPQDAFPERMGGGACWLDADLDGLQDLFLVNGWYHVASKAAEAQPRSALYLQKDFRAGFEDVAAAAGLDLQGWTQACSAADYDADGDEDLLVVGLGIQRLFRNAGDGTFDDVSAAAGISAAGKCPDEVCWGSGSAWADYDGDGCLDVVVINFVAWNFSEGSSGGPLDHDGQPMQLYRSGCDGTFSDVTAAANATGDPGPDHGKNWGVTWTDYDRDGDPDLYVASDGTPNILLRNEGDGTFADVAVAAGVADLRNGMGLTAGDCDEDGYEDLFFTHYSAPFEIYSAYDGFYVNDGDGTFTDRSGDGDLNLTWPYIKWGTKFEDVDNDGHLDLHAATGHTEPVADRDQPMFLWRGDGACNFTDMRAEAGAPFTTFQDTRGTSYADYDLDGDVDIAVVNILEEPFQLLRASGAGGHWLDLELRQPGGNPRGVLAEVTVTTQALTQHRVMNPYQSIHGSGPAQLHIGLGNATRANLTVTWPDGATTVFTNVSADAVLRLHRDGTVQTDTLPPRTALSVAGAPTGAPGWWQGPVSVTLTASDRAAGMPSGWKRTLVSVDGGPLADHAGAIALGHGPHVLRYQSEDLAGNVEPLRVAHIGVDAEAPTSTADLAGTLVDGWFHGPVTATLSCADAGSGPGLLTWRLDEADPQAYAGPFQLTRPGAHTLRWHCTDLAGNVEVEQSRAFQLDLGHPETLLVASGTPGLAGWWRSAVTVRLDPAGGLQTLGATWYALDGDAPQAYAGPFTVGEGIHEMRFGSVDAAGREEPPRTAVLRVDTLPPDVTLDVLGRQVATPTGLIVGATHTLLAGGDDAGSGLVTVEVRVDEGSWLAASPPPLTGEGPHAVAVRGQDAAGNVGMATRSLVLDTTAPSLSIVAPRANTVLVGDEAVGMPLLPFGWRAIVVGAVDLEAGVGADVAGAQSVAFLVEGVEGGVAHEAPWRWRWEPPLEPGYYHIAFEVEDRVGNARSVTFEVVATGGSGALEGSARWVEAPLPLVALVAVAVSGRRR